MSTQRLGWYRLNRGRGPLFYGPVPAGETEVPGPDGPTSEAAAAQDLGELSKAGLVELAKGFGLASSGSRAALIERLEEHVASLDSGSQVESVALVDEGLSDGEELVAGEPGADGLDQDSDAFGHGD